MWNSILLIIVTNIQFILSKKIPIGPRIIGGHRVDLFEINYQVSIQFANDSVYLPYCGGAVISAKHVITAAHCLYKSVMDKDEEKSLFSPDEMIVIAEVLDISDVDKAQKRLVKEFFIHDSYGKPQKNSNDIAIIKVWKRFVVQYTLKPISLRVNKSEPGESCVVTGYGAISFKGEPSWVLLKVTVPIVSMETCRHKYGDIIESNMICAGLIGRDSCQGDSGGPLVCDGELAGIVSFGYKCGLPDYPGVYSEIAPHAEWINKVMEDSGTNNIQFSHIFIIFGIFISLAC